VTNQIKILTTAVFSVLLLGKTFRSMQWSALFILMIGVAIFHSKGKPAEDEDADGVGWSTTTTYAAGM
jgi:drug/metabolite transporter (DMT)-like permease